MGEVRTSNLDALKKRRKQRKKRRIRRAVIILILFIIAFFGFGIYKIFSADSGGHKLFGGTDKLNLKTLEVPDYVDVQLIDVGLGRTGLLLTEVKDIAVHYTGNPGSTAQNNRDYFNKPSTDVSSHFVIGIDGEIIQCIPLDEKSAATNNRNKDTISIEVCHEDETGQFSDAAYASLVKLTAWLCENSDLDEENVIRHYDVTGKECPLYYVRNEDKWEDFKSDVKDEMGK